MILALTIIVSVLLLAWACWLTWRIWKLDPAQSSHMRRGTWYCVEACVLMLLLMGVGFFFWLFVGFTILMGLVWALTDWAEKYDLDD